MKRLISLAISLVLACQMALPVFAQAGTETQTTTESGSTQQQTEASTGTETSTGTDTSAPTEGQEATGEQTTGSTEVTALPTITSQSYIVMNADTGQVLISRYPDNKQYPGDITKVLTTALALEYVDPESTYTITTEDVFPTYPESYRFSNGTYVAITQDEVVNIRDLLYATTIQSADDTANALADCAAKLANRSVTLEDGSTSYTAGFVEMMNEKVQDLGCVNTNFVNPHGLYNDNHYTTAYDMALITRYALTTPNFLQYFGQTEYSMDPTNKQSLPRNWRRSSDESMMLTSSDNYYSGILGMETGMTTQGNYTGVAVAERDGIRLICVALNCTGSSAYSLQADMTNLFDYCFNNFTAVTYTAEELAPTGFQTPVYTTDADGNVEMIGTATYSTDSDFTVLLHKNFTKDDIVISSDIPGRYYEGQDMPSTLTFSIVSSKTEEAMSYMVPTMTALKLKVSVLTFSEVEAQRQQARQELFNRIFNIVKIVFFVFLGLLVILLIIRFRNKRKYKKRLARKKAQARRRQQLAQQQGNPPRRNPSSNTPRRKR